MRCLLPKPHLLLGDSKGGGGVLRITKSLLEHRACLVIIYYVLLVLRREKSLPVFALRMVENNNVYLYIWSQQGCLVKEEVKDFTVSWQTSSLRHAGWKKCLEKCGDPVQGSDISVCRMARLLIEKSATVVNWKPLSCPLIHPEGQQPVTVSCGLFASSWMAVALAWDWVFTLTELL